MGDQEISMSIEETNRVRAELGLKPLVVTEDDVRASGGAVRVSSATPDDASAAAAPVVSDAKAEHERWRAEKEERDARASSKATLAKIAESREQRRLQQKLRLVKTLGESDDEDDSAAAWVARARSDKSKDAARAEAAKKERELEELDAETLDGRPSNNGVYTSDDLQSLNVEHDIRDIEEGDNVVLTLKDRGVLDNSDNEEDTLENIHLREKESIRKNMLAKSRHQGYTGYDDDEFDEYGRAKVGAQSMLRQYDEVIYGDEKRKFQIGKAKEATEESKVEDSERERIRSMLSEGNSRAIEAKAVQSDYFTPEEMLKVEFKKKKKKDKKKGKKGRVAEEEEGGGGVVRADDLIAMEETDEPMGDSGELSESERAKVRASNVVDESAIYGMADMSDNYEESTIERELRVSLERVRAMKKAKQLREEEEQLKEIALIATEQREQEERAKEIARKEKEEREEAGEESETDDQLVFSSTTEFVRIIGKEDESAGDTRVREEQPKYSSSRKQMETEEEGDASDGQTEMDCGPDERSGQSSGAREEFQLDEQPMAKTGLAAVLQLAQQRKLIASETGQKTAKQVVNSVNIRPRNDEKRLNDFEISYTDEKGRELTQKQAYVQLSHHFHGKGPGRIKKEKLLKREQEEKERQMAQSSLNRLESVQSKQKAEGTAHLVVRTGARNREVPTMEVEKKAVKRKGTNDKGGDKKKKKKE